MKERAIKTTCQKRYGISASDFVNEISKWDKNDTEEIRNKRWGEFCEKHNITDYLAFISDAWFELGDLNLVKRK